MSEGVREGTGFTSSGRLLETRGILMTSGTRSSGRNGRRDVMQEEKKNLLEYKSAGGGWGGGIVSSGEQFIIQSRCAVF